MPSHTTHNTPALRFPGYTGVWEQQQLEDLFEYERPDKYIVKTTDYSTAQLVPVLTANKGFILGYTEEKEGIHDNTPTILFDDFTCDMKYVNFKFKVKSSAMKLLYMRDRAMPLRFGYELLKHLHYQPHSHSRHWISTMQSITTVIPSVEEQQKIADFFCNLDGLINLHQRQTEQLKKLKQGLLHEMFPREGESVPRLRFPGFTTTWEQQKFSDFTWNAGKRNKDNLDLEAFAITNDRGFIRQNEAHDDFGYMKNTDRRAYNIVEPYSFAYNPARINVGSIGYYEGTEDVMVSSLYEVFKTADYIDDRFLWHWFKSDKFPQWITKLQEGSVRLYFYYDKLCECQMLMPSLDEQKKIATLFDNLDDRIDLHQQQTEKLTELKKGLLQKMFPQD